jgi:broad specificity phosphatase PhoE
MLILVRHGETEANARGLLLGRADPPLSLAGRLQAQALAALIPADARIVASPLRRARETAEAFGRAVDVEPAWIELDYGALDGHPIGDIPAAMWHQWRTDPHFAPDGGESLATLGTRVRAACESLSSEARGGDVVVVSHVSPIKAAIGWALDAGDEIAWKLFVRLASMSRIRIDERGTTVLSLNEAPPSVP